MVSHIAISASYYLGKLLNIVLWHYHFKQLKIQIIFCKWYSKKQVLLKKNH